MVDATAVTYNIGGTGSISEFVQDPLSRTCWAEDFGALADGTHDDAGSIQAAFDAGKTLVKLRSNVNYYAKSQVKLPPAGVISCDGRGSIVQHSSFSGVILDMSKPSCGLQNVLLSGTVPTAAGGGIIINTAFDEHENPINTDQFVNNGGAVGFGGHALEFFGADAGARFRANSANFQSLAIDTAAPVASVQMPNATGEQIGGREFIGCGALGSTLIDFGKSANARVVGGNTARLAFTSGTTRAIVSSMRIGSAGETLTIDGQANSLVGCEIAGPVRMAATSKGCTFAPSLIATGYDFQDLTTNTGDDANDVYGLRVDLTPSNFVWGQAIGTGPSLGKHGTLSGRLARTGRRVSIDVTIVPGSDTSFGDGAAPWTFTLLSPAIPPNAKARTSAVGSALAFNAGVCFETGIVVVQQGSVSASVSSDQQPSSWGKMLPHIWKNTGDYFVLSYEFELG